VNPAQPVLLLLAEAEGSPGVPLDAALGLADTWRGESGGRVELWGAAESLAPGAGRADAMNALVGMQPGARLWLALCSALAKGAQPLLWHVSAASVGAGDLCRARERMTQHDLVLGLGANGECVLLGLTHAVPELFAGWSARESVAEALRARARQRGVPMTEFVLDGKV